VHLQDIVSEYVLSFCFSFFPFYKKKLTKINKFTIASQNPFATLKYAVKAVSFFDDQSIPLLYFIEGYEEAKFMMPAEAESQFIVIR